MQSAAALALSAAMVTAPATAPEPSPAAQAPSAIQRLRDAPAFGPGAPPIAGPDRRPGCGELTARRDAVQLANGRVQLLLPPSERLRVFGRVNDIYDPGDLGYSQALGYLPGARPCGGGNMISVDTNFGG